MLGQHLKYNIDVESFLNLASDVDVYWKDIHSNYLGCNDLIAETIGLRTRHDIVGKNDFDTPMSQAEAMQARHDDQMVIKNNVTMQFHNTLTLPDLYVTQLTLKMPLYDSNGVIVGVFGLSRRLKEQHAKTILLNSTLQKVPPPNKPQFTRRQTLCLYHLVKGMTAKQSAKIMGLSYRTVESYLDNLKAKLNCNSRVALIEKALQVKEIQTLLLGGINNESKTTS